MEKSKGISARELAPELLAQIGMGNYLQRQTLSLKTTENNQKIIPIPMVNYDARIYKFDLIIDGLPYLDYRYDIDENAKSIIIKDTEAGIAIDKQVDFIFSWNTYINKRVESPTVYLEDCNTKVCSIEHNMNKYPQIQILEVLYGAGIGNAGAYPAGAPSKMIYPRIDYVNTRACDIYLNDEYAVYANPKLNRVSEGKYIVTFDAPCVKSLLILVDKLELFASDESCYINNKVTAINSPAKGFVHDQVIYGTTLQNIWNLNSIKPVWDVANSKGDVTDITQNMYKAGKYTVINTSDKTIFIRPYDKTSSTYGADISIAAKSYAVVTLANNVILGSIVGKGADNWSANNYYDLFTACVVLDGDYSTKIMPTGYFSGIKSLGSTPYTFKAVNTIDESDKSYSEVDNEYNVLLRGIGAFKDEYSIDTGILKRYIATAKLGYDFIDSVSFDVNTGRTNTYRLVLTKNCDLGDTAFGVDALCDKAVYLKTSDFMVADKPAIFTMNYLVSGTKRLEINISVEKSKLTDTTISGIITYLKNNSVNVFYTTQTATEEKVSNLPIKINDDSRYIIADGIILPEAELYYPLNIKSSVDNLIDSVNLMRDVMNRISELDGVLLEIAKMKMDIGILKDSSANGMNQNLFSMQFASLSNIELSSGIHDSATGKIYM